MLEKLMQELSRAKISLRVAEELEFKVWATLEISGEEYERLQSEVSTAVDKLRGRYAALDELEKKVNPDLYWRMLESYWKYSELAEKLEGVA